MKKAFKRLRIFRAKYWLLKNYFKKVNKTQAYNLEGGFGIHRISEFLLLEADHSEILENDGELKTEFLALEMSMMSYHTCIMFLASSGHAVEALGLVRPLIIHVLILYYVIEDDMDKRMQEYIDWVQIQALRNLRKSQKSSLANSIITEDYVQITEDRNHEIKIRVGEDQYKRIEHRSDFLTPTQRLAIAQKMKIEGEYEHVFAEGSASIHGSAIYDRIITYAEGSSTILMSHDDGAYWPLMLANLFTSRIFLEMGRKLDIFDFVKRQIMRLVYDQK